MLGNLMYQTAKPSRILCLHSGYDHATVSRMREEFPAVEFVERPNLVDWGHDKRAHGLGLASEDFVGWFNDDDRYADNYLEEMLRLGVNADVVYCAWDLIPHCGFGAGASTSGNFIVRTQLGKEVGYEGRTYAADGEFIDLLAQKARRIVKHPEILYFWNGGVQRGEMAQASDPAARR